MVIRGEEYLKAYPDTALSKHRPDGVIPYLTDIGRKGSLKDWQFRQIVDALEALFSASSWLRPGRAGSPWGYWNDSARSWSPITPPSRATYRYRRQAAATLVERPIRVSAQCGGYTERCPARRSVSYTFGVFPSVRPARPASRWPRNGQW